MTTCDLPTVYVESPLPDEEVVRLETSLLLYTADLTDEDVDRLTILCAWCAPREVGIA